MPSKRCGFCRSLAAEKGGIERSDKELIRTLFNQKCDLSETLARMKHGDELIEYARAHFMDCLSLDQQECIARDPHPYERMIVEIYGDRNRMRNN